MTEHDCSRNLLPLSASGDISAEDLRLLRAHFAGCESCRRLSDDFASLSGTLRGLATPQPSSELVARVRELADMQFTRNRGWSTEATLIAPLIAFSWAVAILTWPLMLGASAWIRNWWQIPGDGFKAVLAVYSVAGFVLASLAALAVAKCAKMSGRTR